MQEITIRQVTVEDAAQLCHLLENVSHETPYLLNDLLSVEQEKQLITHYIRRWNCVLIVAECAGELIGMSNLIGKSQLGSDHNAEVGVCVLKEYWGYGIGRILMQEVMSYARTVELRMLTLEVNEDNERAKRLYLSLGFKQCGQFHNRLCYNEGYHHTVVMEYDLLKNRMDKREEMRNQRDRTRLATTIGNFAPNNDY